MTRYFLALLISCGTAAAQPAWTLPLAGGIEWSAVVGRDEKAALLLATPAGELHLVDLQTGKSRLTTPIRGGRGVRLAAGSDRDNVAYCFDRHAAYAIQLAAPAGLKWQYGQAVGANEELRDDPEKITGWTHAAVTPAGLLLVSSEGRVVLLAQTDGHAIWELELGPMPVARLHVRDKRAVVLWKTEGAVRAVFLALDQEAPKPAYRNLGSTWPIWSDLVPAGLLTLSAGEVALWPTENSSTLP
jgi:hypothetical protein